jgi:hypothetical protein
LNIFAKQGIGSFGIAIEDERSAQFEYGLDFGCADLYCYQLMPIELRNIKGGGLHYVAYKEFKTAISSQPRRSFSEQVLSTTLPTTSA